MTTFIYDSSNNCIGQIDRDGYVYTELSRNPINYIGRVENVRVDRDGYLEIDRSCIGRVDKDGYVYKDLSLISVNYIGRVEGDDFSLGAAGLLLFF
ncbi:MAG: hypothetical protein M1455_11135 [Actinobacteria bacterium]|nr:hypothetical protein [Actinomycetota bacterium]